MHLSIASNGYTYHLGEPRATERYFIIRRQFLYLMLKASGVLSGDLLCNLIKIQIKSANEM